MPKKKGAKSDAQAASPAQPSNQNVDADAFDDEAELQQESEQATQQQKNMFEQEERKVDPTDVS